MSLESTQTRLGTVALLFQSAQRLGLRPEWITPDGLFVIKTLAGEHYISNGRSSLNSHVSMSLAQNKYQTRQVLDRHNLPNIAYTRVGSLAEAEAFLRLHDVIIAKPVRGSGSRDIHIVRQIAQLRDLNLIDYILERYTPGRELRYLILQNEVIGVHESSYGDSVAADRELERISYDIADWDPLLVATARKTLRVLGLSFGAVDFMIDASGQAYILEVNSCPGFKWFHAPSSGPPVDVATKFLKATLHASPIRAPHSGGLPFSMVRSQLIPGRISLKLHRPSGEVVGDLL
jgi:glutathione synthase/RimK-type ligase-like ATP-grasp enzyme